MAMKALKWFGGFVAGLVVLGLLVFVVFVWPMIKRLDAAKPAIMSLAADFSKCLEAGDVSKCSDFTSDKFKTATPVSDWADFNFKIHKAIGNRVSAELDDKSLNINSVRGIEDSGELITAKFKAMYDNDPFVLESYTFRYSSEGKKYVIDSFHVESKLFMK